MNRYETIQKYVFKPPKFSNFWAPIIYWISDTLYLHGKHKIKTVNVAKGGKELLEKINNNDSLLITPNHSDHADPHVLTHLNRSYKIPIHFMAARETFEVNKGFNGKVMQRVGVFSIDRDGADIKALKEAMKIVYEGEFPLVMFPEGEIYHLNEKLTPLNEGAATIMLKTAKKLKKEGGKKGCYIIPTAMKYTYIDDVSSTFSPAMECLERHMSLPNQNNLDLVDRIYNFGEAVLSIKENELLGTTLEGNLVDRIKEFRERLISELEDKYVKKTDKNDNHPSRIRKVKGKIQSIILETGASEENKKSECYQDLDRLYLAVQLFSYPGQYLTEKSSQNRIAETILKFEEDLLGEYKIKGQRKAEITFCDAINLYDFVDDEGNSPKTAVRDITEKIEAAIKGVLESPSS